MTTVSRQRHTAERKGSLRDLHPQILRGGARAGIQFAAGAARGLRGLHQQPTTRRLGVPARGLRRRRVLRRDDGSARSAAAARRHRGGPGRHRRRLQDRPADPLARRFCQDRRDPRCEGRLLRFGHAAVQHDDLDGALDPQRAAVLCAVRARGHRRAHPRQDRRLEKEGDVDGRRAAARVSGAGPQARRRRQRGGNRALDLPPLCRTRLGAVVEGGARRLRDQKQVVDERFGSRSSAASHSRAVRST